MAQYLLEEALLEMLDALKLAAAQEQEREFEKQRLIEQTHQLVDREMGRA